MKLYSGILPEIFSGCNIRAQVFGTGLAMGRVLMVMTELEPCEDCGVLHYDYQDMLSTKPAQWWSYAKRWEIDEN